MSTHGIRNRLPSACSADAAPAGSNEGDERINQQLAELLEARERSTTRNIDATTSLHCDPDVASQLTAYLETAELVERVGSGLTSRRGGFFVPALPVRLGEYEVVREIGRGGTAVVYEARQPGLKRSVAIKMLTRDGTGSMFDVERLRFEAEAVAHLAHPGIVPVYEVGEHDGCPWFSMQLYERGSLTGSLDGFSAQPRRAAELVQTVAQAVHFAHQRGILHRDLKPSNILLDGQGRPGVADFGLAKRMGDNHDLTQPGELMGTPAYMAPERVSGSAYSSPATVATDVYGLGAILYALLTGKPPFEAATPVETLLAVGTADLVRPSRVNPRIEPDLETICLKALEKNPADRYASAAELAQDLRSWLDGEPILARPIRGLERLRRWTRRHPVQATAALSALLLVLVAAVGLTTGYIMVSRAYRTAEAHRRTAESHAAELSRRFYVSQMSLAHRLLERGELNGIPAVLHEFRSQPEQQGFEWRWFDRLARTMPPETARFTAHTHFLYGGTFSPTDGSAATCGADGMIRIWDTATGVELRSLPNGSGLSPAGVPYDENCVRFTPDGKRLVSCGEDGGVRVWTLADGARRELAAPQPGEALSLDVSADGTRAVAGWVNGSVRIWSLDTGELQETLPPFGSEIEEVRFIGPTNRLLVLDRSGRISICELSGGRRFQAYKVGDRARAAAVSTDGALFAAAGVGGVVEVFSLEGDRPLLNLHAGGEIRSIDICPHGSRIAAIGNDGCVFVWSLPSGTLESFFKAHQTTAWQVAFSPSGDRLLTVSSDMVARIWNLEAQRERPDRGVPAGRIREVVYSPDDCRVLTVSAEGDAELWDRRPPHERIALPVRVFPDSRPQFTADGREAAFFDANGAIQFWDCTESRLRPAEATPPDLAGHNPIVRSHASLELLKGGRLVALSRSGNVSARENGQWRSLRRSDELSDWARIIGKAADGTALLALRDAPSRLEFWHIEPDRVRIGTIVQGLPQSVAAARDGQTIAIGRPDGTIEIVDATSGMVRKTLLGHDAHVLSVAFSPDGRTLASASADGTARLWNLATGTEISVVDRRENQVAAVVFSPDGRELAIGGDPRPDRATVQFLRSE